MTHNDHGHDCNDVAVVVAVAVTAELARYALVTRQADIALSFIIGLCLMCLGCCC